MAISSSGDRNRAAFSTAVEGEVVPSVEQRIYNRRPVIWPGQLRLASLKMGRHEFSCQIWNLSLNGARLRIDVPLQAGTEVYLSVGDKAEIPSTVVWAEDNKMGVKFRMGSKEVLTLLGDQAEPLGLTPSDMIAD